MSLTKTINGKKEERDVKKLEQKKKWGKNARGAKLLQGGGKC